MKFHNFRNKNSGNFTYNINNKYSIVNNGITPFDDYYSNSSNTYHISAQNDLGLFDDVKTHEIMPEDLYIQNRIFSNDRDFEAAERIEIGKNVQPWGTAKIQATGNVSLQNNCNITLTAGESIVTIRPTPSFFSIKE